MPPASTARPTRPGTFESLARAMRSWRTLSVALLSFSSGLPLGLVWYAIPDWMRSIGVDLRVVGLFSLAQVPWTFKVIWSPLMDRYVPPFWGRRRGWMAVTQIALAALGLMLAGVGSRPEAIWVVGALALATALASATQDIAIDAYAVEVLHDDEQGAASARASPCTARRWSLSGGGAITMAARLGWPTVNVLLALVYVPMLVLTWKAPEPEGKTVAAAQPARGGLAAVPRVPRATPRARDPRVRPALQVRRPAHDVDDAAVPHRHGVHRVPSRRRARHGRHDRDHCRRVHRRLGDHADGPRPLALGLRLPADVRQRRLLLRRASRRAEPPADVRRDELRAVLRGPRHRRVLGPAAAPHAEALLGHAVRPLLEPLRAAAAARRARSPGSRSTRSAGRPSSCPRSLMGVPGLVMLARFVPLGVREPQFEIEEGAAIRRPPLGAARPRASGDSSAASRSRCSRS